MLYNAILRDYVSSAILGRAFVRDLQQVPSPWLVEYRGSYISKKTALEGLFCSRDEPLHLVKFPSENDGQIVFVKVKTNDGKILAIGTHEAAQIEDLKKKIANSEGVPVYNQRLSLLFNGDRLQDGTTLKDYGIVAGAVHIIDLDLPLIGGGGQGPSGFFAVNLEGRQFSGKGVYKTRSWEIYDLGMNLYGFCINPSCISKKTVRKMVVIPLNYGRVRLSRSWSQFECPACKGELEKYQRLHRGKRRPGTEENEEEPQPGTFTPHTFLLTYGRALFRFKKSGMSEPVKTVLMESLGTLADYRIIDKAEGICEYDFVEITTVGKNSSPYNCVHCTRRITDKEVTLFCGHSYHLLCLETVKDGRRECAVCNSRLLRTPNEVLAELGLGNEMLTGWDLALDWNFDYHLADDLPEGAMIDEWRFEMEENEILWEREKEEMTREWVEEMLEPMKTRRGTAVGRGWIFW